MSYQNISIQKVMKGISENKYLLPAVQREIVWDTEQIEKLFDSILSGYPINSMLFWNYKIPKTKDKYKFYEFIKAYDAYNASSNHNKEHDLSGKRKITAVLDGQQRLTALFIGLKGYMNLKKPHLWANNANNFEKKYLYLNLLYDKKKNNDEDTANEYEFRFKTEKQVENDHKMRKALWFKVGKILDNTNVNIYKKTLPSWWQELKSAQKKKIDDIFIALKKHFIDNEEVLNYYMEKTDSLDKVLKIFVRINDGGTPLDYTDFLMSMIVSKWSGTREAINNAIDAINKDYNFNLSKDSFLRACLYLTNSPLSFKADNFKSSAIGNIEKNFEDIVKYLRASCCIFNMFGYTRENLKSSLILFPVAQFLMLNKTTDLTSTNRNLICDWIRLSILGRVFSSQTINYLTNIRKQIKGKKFPLEDIKKVSIKLGRDMSFNKKLLEELLNTAKYGSDLSWAILTILYPNLDYNQKQFHSDHIYPVNKLSTEMLERGGNFVANLQLLEGRTNQIKNKKMPNEWLSTYCTEQGISEKQYRKNNYIPSNIPLDLDHFSNYLEERKKLMLNMLQKKLIQN